MVIEHGKLFFAISNEQDGASHRWLIVRRLYNWLPNAGRFMLLEPVLVRLWGIIVLRGLFLGSPSRMWLHYKRERGMSPCGNAVDWVGGYPFEVARPEEMFEFFKNKDFTLV